MILFKKRNWNYGEPEEGKSVLAYIHSNKTNRNCYSIAKKVCGFWFLQRYIDEINIPVLNEYEVICRKHLPALPCL